MALRFYSELESSEGNIWKVEILDDDFVGAAAEFTLASPGFTLSYTGGQDLFAPLMPSNCVVHMMVQNAAELQLITDLSDFQEGRFLVRVIADPDVAANVHWVGMLTAESLAVADEYYPQAIDIRAICGLATLSTVPFDEDAGALTGSTTLGRVYQVLAQIPTASLYETADVYFAIGTDVQPDTGDEFIDSVRMQDATYNELEEGETISDSEEMLSQICMLLNSRISMINGRWMIAPISKMMDIGANLTNVRKYVKAGTLSSTSTESVAYALIQGYPNYRLTGWQQQYLPAVRKITRQVDYLGNAPFAGNWRVQPSSFGPIGTAYLTQITHTATAEATLPTTQKVTVVGAVEWAQGYISGLTGDNQLVRYRVEMTVKVGSLYLNRQTPFLYDSTEVDASELGGTSGEIFNPGNPGPFTWSTNSANRVTYFSDILTVGNSESQEVNAALDWAFTTPEIGTTQDADVVVTIEVRGYNGEASIGNPTAYIAPSSVRDACTVWGDVQLFLGESVDTGDTLSFSASIANGATEELELNHSRYGEVTTDALYLYNPGALLITGGNPTGFTSAGTTSSTPINELLCLDRLRHMAKQQEVFAGGAIGADLLTPLNRIGSEGGAYLISQLTMSAETDYYDLELTLVEALDTSTPTGGAVVRSSKLPSHTTAGSSVSVAEGQRRVSQQNAVAIALEAGRTDALVIGNLVDVDTTTRAPSDGELLEWVAADSKWKPAAAAGGGSPLSSADQQIADGTTRVIDVSSAGAPATALEIKAGSVVLARFASSVFGVLTEATFSPLAFQVNSALLLKGNTSALSGQVSMYENSANGSELVAWKAPAAIASSFVLTLPDALPTADGQLMSFDPGAGLATASFVKNWQYVVLQSAFYASTTSRIYIPLSGGSQSESTGITSSVVLHPCPFDGEIVRIAHSGYGGGSTDVTTHLNQSTTPLETINTTLAGGGYTNVTEVNFTALSAFSKGDIIHIGMDGTTVLGTSRVTVVLRYDTTT